MAKLKHSTPNLKVEGKIVHTSENVLHTSLPNILAQQKINASKNFQNGLLAHQAIINPKFMSENEPITVNKGIEKETYEQNEETGLNC